MHPILADMIVESVRKRASQGDCPTEPAQSVEMLEETVLELAGRPAHTLRTLAEGLRKFAPDLADQIARRWAEAIKDQDDRLEQFLEVLRQPAPPAA